MLAETLKDQTINNAGYYASDSETENGTKVDPVINPKTVTHTSDGNKRKVTDTRKGYLQQKLLSIQNLPIITTTMYPRIDDSITDCSGTPHTLVTPTTKEVIMDAAHSSARVLRNPRHVILMDRDGTTPGDTPHDVSPPPG